MERGDRGAAGCLRARFAARLPARPKGPQGPEGIPERHSPRGYASPPSQIGRRRRRKRWDEESSGISRRDGGRDRGECEERSNAAWAGGSRSDDGRVGAAPAQIPEKREVSRQGGMPGPSALRPCSNWRPFWVAKSANWRRTNAGGANRGEEAGRASPLFRVETAGWRPVEECRGVVGENARGQRGFFEDGRATRAVLSCL